MEAHEFKALTVLGTGLVGAMVIYLYGTGRARGAYALALATAVTGTVVAAAHTVSSPVNSGLGRVRVLRPARVLL